MTAPFTLFDHHTKPNESFPLKHILEGKIEEPRDVRNSKGS